MFRTRSLVGHLSIALIALAALWAGAPFVAQALPGDDTTGTVAGTATRADGTPFPGAKVDLMPQLTAAERRAGVKRERYSTTADDKGRFRFEGVAPGTYQLLIYHGGLCTVGSNFEVVAGETAEADIAVPRLSSLAGTLKAEDGTPVEGARVAMSLGGGMPRQARSDRHGRYKLDRLITGNTWRLTVTLPGGQQFKFEVKFAPEPEDIRRDYTLPIPTAPAYVPMPPEAPGVAAPWTARPSVPEKALSRRYALRGQLARKLRDARSDRDVARAIKALQKLRAREGLDIRTAAAVALLWDYVNADIKWLWARFDTLLKARYAFEAQELLELLEGRYGKIDAVANRLPEAKRALRATSLKRAIAAGKRLHKLLDRIERARKDRPKLLALQGEFERFAESNAGTPYAAWAKLLQDFCADLADRLPEAPSGNDKKRDPSD